MADERLQIQIDATDDASPVLRQVAQSATSEMQEVAGAADEVGDASEQGFGRATDAAEEHAQAVGGVVPELEQIESATDQVADTSQGSWSRMSSYVEEHEQQIQKVGLALAAVGAATVAIAASNLKAYYTQEEAELRLDAAIRATGKTINAGALKRLASDLQEVTAYGDEGTIAMQAMLITLGADEQQVKRMTPVVLDLAAAFGMNLETSARLLARTVIQGDDALKRYGISIADDIREAGDFEAMLGAVESRVGGTAEAMAGAGGGAKQLANAFGDLREIMGSALAPTFKLIVDVAKPVVSIMQSLADTPAGKVLVAVGTAGGIAAGGLGMIGLAAPAVLRGLAAIDAALIKVGITSRATAATVSGSAAQMATATTAAGAAAGAGAAGAGVGAGAAAGGGIGLGARGILAGGAIGAAAPVAIGGIIVNKLYKDARLGALYIAKMDREGKPLSKSQRLRLRLGGLNQDEYEVAKAEQARITAGESPDDMAAWRGQMQAKWGAAEVPAEQLAQAIPQEIMPSPELSPARAEELRTLGKELGFEPVGLPAAAAPARRGAGGMTEVGPGAWSLPGIGAPGAGPYEPGGASVRSIRTLGPNRFEIIVEVEPNISPGVYDEYTSEWMDDLAYAGAS